MPITVNIPPVVRFALYMVGAVGSLGVIYAIQKGYAGDAEYQLWTGIAGLLSLLAATKTPITTSDDEAGHVNWAAIAAVATVVLVVIVLFGWQAEL